MDKIGGKYKLVFIEWRFKNLLWGFETTLQFFSHELPRICGEFSLIASYYS
jgi:hypothetical protein